MYVTGCGGSASSGRTARMFRNAREHPLQSAVQSVLHAFLKAVWLDSMHTPACIDKLQLAPLATQQLCFADLVQERVGAKVSGTGRQADSRRHLKWKWVGCRKAGRCIILAYLHGLGTTQAPCQRLGASAARGGGGDYASHCQVGA
jgi:hypothetical protein